MLPVANSNIDDNFNRASKGLVQYKIIMNLE